MAISLDTSQSTYGACQTPPQTGATQASPPADAVAPTDDQLTATAKQLVGKPGGGGHHHHHHGGGTGAAQGVQMPDSSILSALAGTASTDSTSSSDSTLTQLLQNLTSSDSSDSTDSSLQQLLQQLNGSSSPGYSSDGTTPAASGSLGLSALV